MDELLGFGKTVFSVAPEWATLLIIVVVILKYAPLKEIFTGRNRNTEGKDTSLHCGNTECQDHARSLRDDIERRFQEFRNDIRDDVNVIREDIRELRRMVGEK